MKIKTILFSVLFLFVFVCTCHSAQPLPPPTPFLTLPIASATPSKPLSGRSGGSDLGGLLDILSGIGGGTGGTSTNVNPGTITLTAQKLESLTITKIDVSDNDINVKIRPILNGISPGEYNCYAIISVDKSSNLMWKPTGGTPTWLMADRDFSPMLAKLPSRLIFMKHRPGYTITHYDSCTIKSGENWSCDAFAVFDPLISTYFDLQGMTFYYALVPQGQKGYPYCAAFYFEAK